MRERVWACVAGASLATAACQYDDGLMGFRTHEGGPAEVAAGTLADLRAIDAWIDDPAAGREPDETRAYRELLAAYTAIGNDGFRSLRERWYGDRMVPLFLYPRIVAPHVAERIPEDGGRGRWLVPLIMSERALRVPDETNRFWLGWELAHSLADVVDPAADLAFFVTPHPLPPRAPLSAMERLFAPVPVSSPGGSVPLDDEVVFPFPSPRHDAVGLVATVRWDDVERLERELRVLEGSGGRTSRFFDVRALPRVEVAGIGPDSPAFVVVDALRRGAWHELPSLVRSVLDGDGPPGSPELSVALGATAEAVLDSHCRYYESALEPVGEALLSCAEALAEAPAERTVERTVERTAELVTARRRLDSAVSDLLRVDPCPAPVLLDVAPGDRESGFSFVVAADFQYGGDLSAVRRFFQVLDGGLVPSTDGASTDAVRPGSADVLSEETRRRIREAAFVVVAGDLGDGKGPSSSRTDVVLNGLGLTSPESPYAERGRFPQDGEFPELVRELRRFSKPVFAVPGNHDGYVDYGGILNGLAGYLAFGLGSVPILAPLAPPFRWLADEAPTLVRLGIRFASQPVSDGLEDWNAHLGPRNFAFRYRGHGFVGLNTFDMTKPERDAVGGVAFNWGGGVSNLAVAWTRVVLQRLKEPEGENHHQFLFMHHDPRGAEASISDYEETGFGKYEYMDAPVNEATAGYLGLGWSTVLPIYVPVLTPVTYHVTRSFSHERFQQAWIAGHRERELISAINVNLVDYEGDSDLERERVVSASGLSHIFIGHDDVPVVTRWGDATTGSVFFHGGAAMESPDTWWDDLVRVFVRDQSDGPPHWAVEEAMFSDRAADVRVVRLDDIGQSDALHGFHVVHVERVEPHRYSVDVEWIPLR